MKTIKNNQPIVLTYGENPKLVDVQQLTLIKMVMRKSGKNQTDEYIFDSNCGLVSIMFSDLLALEIEFKKQEKLISAELVRYAYETSLAFNEGKYTKERSELFNDKSSKLSESSYDENSNIN